MRKEAPFTPNGIITVTTDFGLHDPYVGAMKGVLRRHAPAAVIDDLSHDISPQDLMAGSFFLAQAVPCYPEGTVHVAVVDPGVGTDRRPVAALLGGHLIVLPDNGLLTALREVLPLTAARAIANPEFQAHEISATFHGRDIFAPAAGRLTAGAPFDAVGPLVTGLVTIDLPATQASESGGVVGEVVYVDHFGNCITNILANMLPEGNALRVTVRNRSLPLAVTYADAPTAAPLALVGSSGRLEIAVRGGNAEDLLRIGVGARVHVDDADPQQTARAGGAV